MSLFTIKNLRTEYLTCPVGLDETAPRFSWELGSEARGILQKSYRITVTDGREIVWDSGRVESSETLNVEYGGEPLKPCTRYTWTVEAEASQIQTASLETASAKSFFETGLLDGSMAAWEGAEFIGGSDKELPFSAHDLMSYRIEAPVRILPGSTRAGIVFGANDRRLMDPDKNILGRENRENEGFFLLELDISGVKEGGCASFCIYRAGHLPTDSLDTPVQCFPVPRTLLSEENLHEAHTLGLAVISGLVEPYVDGEAIIDLSNRFTIPNINPMGRGGNYICFPALCDAGIYLREGQEAEFGPLSVRNYRRPANLLYRGWPFPGEETCTLKGAILRTGRFPVIGLPILRKSFREEGAVRRARLYVTARGIYDLYLNGQHVNENEWFSPGLTQYNRRQGYRTYDVTPLLRGENVLTAMLGEGWWSGAMSFEGENWNFFGDRPSLLLKLVLERADGTREVIVTDDSWKYTKDGPIRYSGFFQGERTDLTRLPYFEALLSPEFDDSALGNAKVIPCTPHTTCMETAEERAEREAKPGIEYDFTWDPVFFGEPEAGVRKACCFTAKERLNPRPGVYIYDIGQNISGIPRIHFPEGITGEVTMRFAEILYPELPEYGENQGMVMMENIRAALAEDHVLLDGKAHVYSPVFTFHGYRYIEITGLAEPLPIEAVESLALSSVTDLSASFETDSGAVNQLFSNITWSFRDNFLSIPTDCPQRNERMGWSGDISVFSRTASYLSLVPGFLRRHSAALRDTQGRNGRFPDIAPVGGGFGGVLWGSAGCTVPYESWRQYGDERVLKEQLDAMLRYLEFLKKGKDPETGIVNDGPLGDWLGPQVYMTETPFLWEAYYIFDLRIAISAARLLNENEIAASLEAEYEDAFERFNRIYIDPETHQTVFSSEKEARGLGAHFGPPDEKAGAAKILTRTPSGRYLMDTQTSYAVALSLDAVRKEYREDLGRFLDACCRRENKDEGGVMRPPYSLMTGFIGTAWVLKALTDTGHADTAWRMLKNDSYPSWLYSVKNGATTIWERLDSYTVENGFGGNNSMNSFNHYSFGAVGDWMLEYAAGIRRGEDPGTFRLAPVPDPTGGIRKLDAGEDTVRGRFEVHWETGEACDLYEVTIPAGTVTTLTLPAAPEDRITEDGNAVIEGRDSASAEPADGILEIRREETEAVLTLGSGTYRFEVTRKR